MQSETDSVFVVPLIQRAITLGGGQPPGSRHLPCPTSATVPQWDTLAHALLRACPELQDGAQQFMRQNFAIQVSGMPAGYVQQEVQASLLRQMGAQQPQHYQSLSVACVVWRHRFAPRPSMMGTALLQYAQLQGGINMSALQPHMAHGVDYTGVPSFVESHW